MPSDTLNHETAAARHLDHLLRLVSQELIHRLCGARACGKAKIVANNDATWGHSGVEERNGVERGLLEININVNEGECLIRDVRETVRYPSFVEDVPPDEWPQIVVHDAFRRRKITSRPVPSVFFSRRANPFK